MVRLKQFLMILIACSSTIALAQTTAIVNTTVTSAASPSVTLYPSFSGLSYEKNAINKSQTTSWGGAAVQSVFKSLGQSIIRVGGNSTDQALWAPDYASTICAS